MAAHITLWTVITSPEAQQRPSPLTLLIQLAPHCRSMPTFHTRHLRVSTYYDNVLMFVFLSHLFIFFIIIILLFIITITCKTFTSTTERWNVSNLIKHFCSKKLLLRWKTLSSSCTEHSHPLLNVFKDTFQSETLTFWRRVKHIVVWLTTFYDFWRTFIKYFLVSGSGTCRGDCLTIVVTIIRLQKVNLCGWLCLLTLSSFSHCEIIYNNSWINVFSLSERAFLQC